MERELSLATLALAGCGATLIVSGSLTPKPHLAERGGREQERAAAWRLWIPVGVAWLVFAALLGWGLQEPDITDEALSPVMDAMAVAIGLIWARALVRAAASLLAVRRGLGAAGTLGLLRPRIVVTTALASMLDASELRAVLEHERAHVRCRDPLRIWVAQLVTDLQWPAAAAADRLRAWRHSLEIARDEEARERGIDGADLGSAIVKAARLSLKRSGAAARLVDGPLLADRVVRLLRPLPSPLGRQAPWRSATLLVLSLAFAVLAGRTFGETFVRVVAGMR